MGRSGMTHGPRSSGRSGVPGGSRSTAVASRIVPLPPPSSERCPTPRTHRQHSPTAPRPAAPPLRHRRPRRSFVFPPSHKVFPAERHRRRPPGRSRPIHATRGGAGGHGVAPDTSSGAALAAPRAGRRLRIGPGAPGRAVSGAERSLFCRSRSTQTTKPTPLIPSRSPLNKHPPPSPADPNPIACSLSPTLSAAPVIPGTAVPAALGSLLRGHGCAPATLRAELRGAVGAGCAHLSCGHGRTDGRTDGVSSALGNAQRPALLPPPRHHRDVTAMSPRPSTDGSRAECGS